MSRYSWRYVCSTCGSHSVRWTDGEELNDPTRKRHVGEREKRSAGPRWTCSECRTTAPAAYDKRRGIEVRRP